jgi:hypothetical protein
VLIVYYNAVDYLVEGHYQGTDYTLLSCLASTSPNAQNRGGRAASPPKTVQGRLNCAARFGDNHSIAAAFHAQNTFIGQFLGGNTVSGLTDIGLK